ncbi:MAG: FISUMP domain-containing protein [Bacteroidota bacterium]
MKKHILLILVLLGMLKVQAQDYLIIFAGSGDTTGVNTVKVDNLTSGATLTLSGNDILHLIHTVGIGNPDVDNGALNLYPNPMREQSTLTFLAPVSGNSFIYLIDLFGKPVCQLSIMLTYGVQSFSVSGIAEGWYFVKVIGLNYCYSTKLVSLGNSGKRASIEHISQTGDLPAKTLKSINATVDMLYTSGDQLLYTGMSGRYSTIVTDVPTNSKTINFNFLLCKDADGQNYTIVAVGSQTWMAENLNVGIRINGVLDQTDNGIIEKYCNADLESNCVVYGGLYQWNEMMRYVSVESAPGICPIGWHLPSDTEWTTLTDYLGGLIVAGGKIKSTGTIEAGTGLWWAPNAEASNNSGFTALPGGWRNYAGSFFELSSLGSFWSSSLFASSASWARDLSRNNGTVSRYNSVHSDGFSVRCIKN